MATLDPTVVYSILRQAGATPQEATTLTAIAGGESGYRTEAFNGKSPDLSYGLFQINMLGAMGPSRLKALGLSSNDQLFDPVNNAKAAVMILRGQGLKAWSVYTNGTYKSYLTKAQAAATKAEPRYSEIAYHTRNTLDYWSKGSSGEMVGTTLGGGLSGPAYGQPGAGSDARLPPNAPLDLVERYIREHYPQSAGLLDVPEIKTKLLQAAQEQWTSTKLTGEVQATTWWRSNGEAARNAFVLQRTDPGKWSALVDAKQAEIAPLLAQLGLTDVLDARDYAQNVLIVGWTEAQIRQDLSTKLAAQGGLKPGTGPAGDADALVVEAKQYLVPIARSDAEQWAIRLYNGSATQESFKSWLTSLAKARYASQPDILAAIDSGLTPSMYFAAHRTEVGRILEVSPDQIDLTDPKWSWMIETVDKSGNRRAPTLGEVQQMARERPEFANTQAYKQTSAEYALGISRFVGAAS